MSLIIDNLKANIMAILLLKLISLVMKVDVLSQATLMLNIVMDLVLMLLYLLEKVLLVTCHA
jgi:hypothetical protein